MSTFTWRLASPSGSSLIQLDPELLFFSSSSAPMETASIAMATATDPRVESEKSGADRCAPPVIYTQGRVGVCCDPDDCDAVIGDWN